MINRTALFIVGLFSVVFLLQCGGGGSGGGATTTNAVITGTASPSVVSKSTDGVCDIDITIAVSVTFSTDMMAASINSISFTLHKDSVPINGTVSYNPSSRTATFTPSSALDYGTTYTAAISTNAQDSAGNALKNDVSWRFTTRQVQTPGNTPVLMGGAMQGNPLKLANAIAAITTVAGSGSPGLSEGIGTSASFSGPFAVTTDGTNLYVSDSNNNKIRKVVISTGEVSTVAGSVTGMSGPTDGAAAAARFYSPHGITTDGTNLYVADYNNNKIRKIVIATGAVSTLAGSGSALSTDGTGTSASFNNPSGITTDGTNLYVSDATGNKIRRIVISTAVVSTLAGSGSPGSSDGTGAAASFHYPDGLTTDGTYLYVCDNNNFTIRKIVISTGVVTTIAGAGSAGSTDGTGTNARFYSSHGITMDGTNLYVADKENNAIRKIVIATGVVSTMAGSGSFAKPTGVTTDGTSLYVSEIDGHRIRKISPPTTVPSSPPANIATSSGDGWITISWDGVSDATSYNIYWSTTSGITTATGTLLACISSPYTLTGLTNGVPYYFIVTAENDIGESLPTGQLPATPAAVHTLTVAKSGTGSGSVSSSPSGISCGSICTASVTNGMQITLSASASPGSTFSGWSGACSGTGSCTVTMDSAKSVTATFTSSSGGGGSSAYYWYNWNCTSSACASFFFGKYTGSLGPFCTPSDCSSWATKYNVVNACSSVAIYEVQSTSPANGLCAQNGVDF